MILTGFMKKFFVCYTYLGFRIILTHVKLQLSFYTRVQFSDHLENEITTSWYFVNFNLDAVINLAIIGFEIVQRPKAEIQF